MLSAYAELSGNRSGHAEMASAMHRGGHVAKAEAHLTGFVTELVREAAASGEIRDDVAPEELGAYCLAALTAAGSLRSKAAVARLVAVTLDGLRPPE